MKISHSHKNKNYLNMPDSKNNNIAINVANRFLTSSNPLLGPVLRGVKRTVKKIRGKNRSRKGSNKSRKNSTK